MPSAARARRTASGCAVPTRWPHRCQGHISDSFAAYADPRAALHAGNLERAVGAVVDLSCTPPWAQAAHQFYDAYAWAVAAEVAVVAALPDAADRLAVAAPAGADNPWAAACLARAHGRRSADRDALRESVAGWERIGARFERACTLLLLPDRAADGYAELVALGCVPGIATPVDDPDTIVSKPGSDLRFWPFLGPLACGFAVPAGPDLGAGGPVVVSPLCPPKTFARA